MAKAYAYPVQNIPIPVLPRHVCVSFIDLSTAIDSLMLTPRIKPRRSRSRHKAESRRLPLPTMLDRPSFSLVWKRDPRRGGGVLSDVLRSQG